MGPRFLIIFTLLLMRASCSSQAQTDLTCYTCDKQIQEKYWKHKKGNICDECYREKNRCWICSLPVLKGYIQTRDGRFVCRDEAKDAVLDIGKAETIFGQTMSAVSTLTRGRLKLRAPQVSVQLFDIDYWNRGEGVRDDASMHRAGMAHSRQVGDKFVHTVLLVSGYQGNALSAICAHELTHLWINESIFGKDRQIEKHTAEAICELVAWKLAISRKDTVTADSIVKNPYTRGRINEVIKLEEEFGLPAILNWVSRGATPLLTRESLRGMGAAPHPSMSTPNGSPLFRQKAKRPETDDELVLKGVLGRIALIGSKSFKEGETQDLLVKGEEKRVTCVRILPKSVFVKIDSKSEEIQLHLK